MTKPRPASSIATMPKIPPLSSLRAFEAVARLRSVTMAAAELNVTHPAISHQIKQLEDHFGVPMVQRVGRGIIPTQAGERLASVLTDSFEQIESVCENIKVANRRPSIAVATVASFASRWLIPRLPKFAAAYPDVDIRVIYAPHETDEMRSDCDVLIRYHEGAHTGEEIATELFSGESRPLCSPAFIERFGKMPTPGDLANVPLLHDQDRGVWAQWFRKASVPCVEPLGGVLYEDFNLMSTAAIAGHGVALCPVELVREDIAQRSLVVLSDIGVKCNGNYLLLHRKSPSPTVIAFRDWLLSEVQSDAPSRICT
ncbi:LysR substrate-binding domain-containing protein [Paraburkholderia agricolaris]|uniref:LysR substrate-binding domain-containing protein n=1 Tax=Paraburkholderia agricolaris TaxID=2152888 RepID=UPI0038BD4AE3